MPIRITTDVEVSPEKFSAMNSTGAWRADERH
jgi:hypothetical protein